MLSANLQLSEPIAAPLDTLAQLTLNPEEQLRKKAQRKALTVFLSGKLIELNTPNIQAYRNMFYCNSVLQQENQELKTAYCKSRFCLVCNAIKTANLINGYVPELQKMADPQFLTLTIKAVGAPQLKEAIGKMQRTFRTINQNLNKYHKIKITAIRKLECNYNETARTFNPHFHFIIDGLEHAKMLRNAWLHLNPRSNLKGQDIRPADHDSMIELFKYATKIVSKTGKLHPKALDVIFTALRNKRIVQPVGIRKQVDEDEREKIIYKDLLPDTAIWRWYEKGYDWVNTETGELLTGYNPDGDIKNLFDGKPCRKQDNIELLE